MGQLIKTNAGTFYIPERNRYGLCTELVKCSCGHGYCSCFDGRCKHCRQGKENRQRFKDWENKGYPVKNRKCKFCDYNLICLFKDLPRTKC